MSVNESVPWNPTHALGDRYVIDRLIGEGAFAHTYRARDNRLSRTVALKVLRPHYAADPSFRERFQREAQAAARVDHINVVHVYDYGAHEGEYFLVLQYVPGRDLRRYIDEHAPLPMTDAVRFTREILAGLAAVHAAGIVHRDIKPQNVLIGWDGTARVTDFGIAHDPGSPHATQRTGNGFTLGTPAYMAPEQARGERVTEQTDLYSVGVVLFELLTGRLPFEAENSLAVMVAHVEQTPPAPSALQPGIPAELDAVVLRALAKHPMDRFPSAQAMKTALVDALVDARDGRPDDRVITAPRMRTIEETRVRAAAAAETVPLPTRSDPPFPQPPATATPAPVRSAAGIAAADARTAMARPVRLVRNDPPHRRLALLTPFLISLLAIALLVAAIAKATGGVGGGNDQRATTAAGIAGGFAATDTPNAAVTPTATVFKVRVIHAATSAPIVVSKPTRTPRPARTKTPTPALDVAPTDVPATDVPPAAIPPTEVLPTDTAVPVNEGAANGVPTIAPRGGGDAAAPPTETAVPPTETAVPVVEDAAASAPVSLAFSASDWRGGLTRSDAGFLGRPWTAVYGANSGYGSASLRFSLKSTPPGEATLTITGVDDENGGDSPITISVNGVVVFSGASPFPSWDGASAVGPWTEVPFTIPAGVLKAGRNEIVVANLDPSANQGMPPYVLVSDTTVSAG